MGVQLGVLIQDGVSIAARLTQLLLEANPKQILKTDFKNAFNNVPRHLVLEQLFNQPSLSRFYRMVYWTYFTPSPQFVRGTSGVEAVVWSCEGVRQGCVFGSLGYAVATLEMFTQVRDRHGPDGVLVVASLDDLCLTGDPAHVFSAFDTLDNLAVSAKSRFNLRSTRCYCQKKSQPPSAKLPSTTSSNKHWASFPFLVQSSVMTSPRKCNGPKTKSSPGNQSLTF